MSDKCKCGCGEDIIPPYKSYNKGHRHPHKNTPVIERFNDKWALNETNGCWEWLAAKDKGGYGVFTVSKYQLERAHRFSYEYHFNDGQKLSSEIMILHECDNRSCVNPSHLSKGTHQDNMDDMTERGRRAKGNDYPHAVLDEDTVRYIRLSREKGISVKELSKELKISISLVSQVANRKVWRWVDA